jgi:hypothetical protein
MIRQFLTNLDGKLDDIVKVNAIGAAAFIVSWSDFDHWLRTLGLIAALIYTGLKIAQTVKEIRK